MAQRLIDAIAWDWGRVLGTFDNSIMWESLATYGKCGPERLKKLILGISKLHATGKMTSPEFYERVVGAAPLKLSYGQFCTAWASCITGENPGIAGILERVRPDIRQCVLSDTDPIHWSAIEKLPVMKKFFPRPEQLVRSYDASVQTLKPGEKIYLEARNRLKILYNEPDRMLYFDDLVPNCTAAALMGIRVQNYNCIEDPISLVKEALEETGALQ